MDQAPQIVFGPFRLDPIKKRLWRGEQEIALQPRPLAVLHYLVVHPGRIVPKEELLKQVWMGTYVTKRALKVGIRAIRKALERVSKGDRSCHCEEPLRLRSGQAPATKQSLFQAKIASRSLS